VWFIRLRYQSSPKQTITMRQDFYFVAVMI
jgi:hypothetical protein